MLFVVRCGLPLFGVVCCCVWSLVVVIGSCVLLFVAFRLELLFIVCRWCMFMFGVLVVALCRCVFVVRCRLSVLCCVLLFVDVVVVKFIVDCLLLLVCVACLCC